MINFGVLIKDKFKVCMFSGFERVELKKSSKTQNGLLHC